MDSSGRVVLADGEAIEWVWFHPGGTPEGTSTTSSICNRDR
jgi:hypothetical protein